MIICETHGPQITYSISPDLVDKVINRTLAIKPRTIKYEYLGEIVHEFYVSPDFENEHNLCELDSILPLADDYPEWVMLLSSICSKCYGIAINDVQKK